MATFSERLEGYLDGVVAKKSLMGRTEFSFHGVMM